MTTYSILPATEADALELGPLLRAQDRAEVEALGAEPEAALLASVQNAAEAWTGRADGQIVCMWGVNPATLIGPTGIPWLLGSDLVPLHRKVFLRENKRWVAHALDLFPLLRNVVDARYAEAIRWIRWMGFTLHDPLPLGKGGAMFIPFTMEAP